MIDIQSLSLLVGAFTVQKGLDYAKRGTVSAIRISEDPLNITGQIAGGERYPYSASVTLTLDGFTITKLNGTCSCPVRMNCKHLVALIYMGLSARQQEAKPVRSAWESALAELVDADEDGMAEPGYPLGLQFELLAPAVAPVRRSYGYGSSIKPGPTKVTPTMLGIRPVKQGPKGKWIRTGISWSNLTYQGYGKQRPNADHIQWLSTIASISLTTSYYSSTAAWIHLDSLTSDTVWDLLDKAADTGISLIGSGKSQTPVTMTTSTAEIVLDVVEQRSDIVEQRSDILGQRSDLALRPMVLSDGAPIVSDHSLLLGVPAHGVVSWSPLDEAAEISDYTLTLTRLRPTPSRELRKVFQDGVQLVPAADFEKFHRTFLPALRRRVRIVSTDSSFEVPQLPPPRLQLTVEHLPSHRLVAHWGWVYSGADHELPLWPDSRPHSYRDLAAEAATLQRISLPDVAYLLDKGRMAPSLTLTGLPMLEFLSAMLPELQLNPAFNVVVVGDVNYREAEGTAVIGISGDASSEGRDWFDLKISVTVDDEEVQLVDIFLALARNQDHMILPSGTYFILESKSFDQLRRLIEEARHLQEPGSSTMRVSRFQSSLVEELQELGVVDSPAAAWHQSVGALNSVAEMAAQPVPAMMDVTLRPYQQEGFNWLSFLHDCGLGGILADDMGLGKTIQALALICRAVESGISRPFLVVAPTSVVGNWRSEALKFAPGLKVAVINETYKRRGSSLTEVADGADIVITSYALFRLEFEGYEEVSWAGLILDEAQFVKNHQSQGYKCAKKLTTPFKLAITGTPMENNLMELWSLFSITAPGLFGSSTKFSDYYAKPIEKSGENEKLALLRRRIRPLMLRRTKDQVAGDLPPKQEQIIELELNPKHQKVYQTHLQRERQKVLGLIEDMNKNRFEIFRSLTLLRRLSLDASLIDEAYAGVPSTKLDALLEQLEDIVAEGHRVLVFSQFTGFLGKVRARLDEVGYRYCYLDGSTRDRPAVLASFKSGDAPIFLISLKAGGFGLNLTEADYVFLLDPWWNPASEAQAIDRVHRIGQTKNVMVYRLVAKGTIEEKVMALKDAKAKLFSSVMEADGASAGALTAEDIRSLLS